MVKRGGRRISKQEITMLKQKEEYESDRVKRVFYIFLDILILVSFSLALYATYFQDYTKTVMFLAAGGLLLIFFILKRCLKKKRR